MKPCGVGMYFAILSHPPSRMSGHERHHQMMSDITYHLGSNIIVVNISERNLPDRLRERQYLLQFLCNKFATADEQVIRRVAVVFFFHVYVKSHSPVVDRRIVRVLTLVFIPEHADIFIRHQLGAKRFGYEILPDPRHDIRTVRDHHLLFELFIGEEHVALDVVPSVSPAFCYDQRSLLLSLAETILKQVSR